ncbi:diguanylate cyclase with PAS/PAC sensor [Shewanella halifaxensis HAW-EB4]|uniref:Diguanylate cyclase with PAS/PAC sensor n=1 Tax=Shewanella halifaxensis (strain HAW-EB4) TaxID=458817 RepID=B0TJH3_SHEHH|nr:GGDEF domain-containing protein [Shewanella halifaxensis]ABZ76969.1 diguanylate cyclase with PAS/PAC sensor [Shewanella halifaxensis HAW-EB4]
MSEAKDLLIASLTAENEALREKSRLLKTILSNAPLLISAKDTSGNILFTNPQFKLLEGPAPEDYVNRNVYELFPKNIADELWNNDLRAQNSVDPIHVEEQVQHKDGNIHSYHTTKFRLLGKADEVIGTCAISIDISHAKKHEFDAYHDSLSGLHNYRYFVENLPRDIARAKRSNKFLNVVLIDLDSFKTINDNLGHDQGNTVLIAVAKALKELFHRPDDKYMRIGGDEFALIFMSNDIDSARNIITQVHTNINHAIEIILGNTGLICTNSIGAKCFKPDETADFDTVYKLIDDALYKVKKNGKNSIHVFGDILER